MDVFLTVCIGVLQAGMAALGIRVSLKSPAEHHHRRFIIAFSGLGIVGIGLNVWIQVRSNANQDAARSQMTRIEQNTKEPPKVIVQNQIDPKQWTEALDVIERKRQVESAPLKVKTLEMSSRILRFAADNQKGMPEMGIPKGSTSEERQQNIDAAFLARRRYTEEASGHFMAIFGTDLGLLFQQLRSVGINVLNTEWRCRNSVGETIILQQCGMELAGLADQVPRGK